MESRPQYVAAFLQIMQEKGQRIRQRSVLVKDAPLPKKRREDYRGKKNELAELFAVYMEMALR